MASDTQHHYLASSILPSAVQNRLPVLTHLRKSISWTAIMEVPVNPLRRSRSQKNSQASTPTSTASLSPPSTPPSGLTACSSGHPSNQLLLPAASIQALEQEVTKEQLRQRHELLASPPRHAGVPPMAPFTSILQPQPNDASGIRWQYAQQGSMLHAISTQSSNDAAFIRKSYIDGVSYLLRGLPDDLNEHEAAIIEQSLPSRCVENLTIEGAQNGGTTMQQHSSDHWAQSHDIRQESDPLFRRAIRRIAVQFILWIYLLFKLITMLLRLGAHYEKRYNISQKVMSRSLGIAGTIGRQGLLMGDSIAQMGEGRVAGALTAMGVWATEQITSGIREGLSEGIELISEDLPQAVPSLRRRGL